MGFSGLEDEALLARLSGSSRDECHVLARVIALLAEVDARKLYLAKAYPSMYAYCTKVLPWSDSKAYRRIRVARAVQKIPALADDLVTGRMHESGIITLAHS